MKAILKRVPDAQLISLVADNATREGNDKTITELPEVDILIDNLGIYESVELQRDRRYG